MAFWSGPAPFLLDRPWRHLPWGPRESVALQLARVLTVSVATEATPEIVDAVGRLLPLLSRSAPRPSAEDVAEIVEGPATTLIVGRDGDDGPILGILTLVIFRIPSGVRAWIEDVIVSEEARGQGCGEALNRAALDVAAAAGRAMSISPPGRFAKPPIACTNGWASSSGTRTSTATTWTEYHPDRGGTGAAAAGAARAPFAAGVRIRPGALQVGSELLDLEQGEPVNDGPEDLLGYPGINPFVLGQQGDAIQHLVFAAAVHHRHVVRPLVTDHALHQAGPLGQ